MNSERVIKFIFRNNKVMTHNNIKIVKSYQDSSVDYYPNILPVKTRYFNTKEKFMTEFGPNKRNPKKY